VYTHAAQGISGSSLLVSCPLIEETTQDAPPSNLKIYDHETRIGKARIRVLFWWGRGRGDSCPLPPTLSFALPISMDTVNDERVQHQNLSCTLVVDRAPEIKDLAPLCSLVSNSATQSTGGSVPTTTQEFIGIHRGDTVHCHGHMRNPIGA
jgi:hypothetical protein